MPQNCWLQYTLYIWQDYTFYKINIQFCSTYIQAKITEQEEGKHYIFKETAMLLWKWRDFKRAQHHDSVYSYIKSQPKAIYLAKEL